MLDHPPCAKSNCLNWTVGHCKLYNPEKVDGGCLDFEDVMDFLRLKADAVRGKLS